MGIIAMEESSKYWEDLIQQYLDGNLSIEEFCRIKGVKTGAFYTWRKRLGIDTSSIKYQRVEKLWKERIASARSSGNETRYCKEHNFNKKTYIAWKRRFGIPIRKHVINPETAHKSRNALSTEEHEYRKRIVQDFIDSGMPVKLWCNEHGINRRTLYDWRVKYGFYVKPAPMQKSTVVHVKYKIRRSDKEWIAIYEQIIKSGVPACRWCSQHNIDATVYSRKKCELQRKGLI